jgi:hypothetical protein
MLLSLLAFISFSIACRHKTNDEEISQDIDKKVAADPEAHEARVSIETNAGKVTLKGKAKTTDARKRVEEIAKEEPGVSDVDDQITVDPEGLASEASSAPAQETVVNLPPPPPPPKPIVVPSGTVLTIRTDQELGSKTSQVGTSFTGSLVTPITVEGKMAIPAGAPVAGTVVQAKKAGRMKGAAILSLSVGSLTVKGHDYNVETEAFNQTSTGKGKRTAGMMIGGTGAGAAIGGLAGGGKGAAIGALVGAGAGTIGAMTGNRDITLPAESALGFRLVQPLTLKPDAND